MLIPKVVYVSRSLPFEALNSGCHRSEVFEALKSAEHLTCIALKVSSYLSPSPLHLSPQTMELTPAQLSLISPTRMMARGISAPIVPDSAQQWMFNRAREFKPTHPPLQHLPCANAAIPCLQPGVKVCSSCKLVTYCSAVCQIPQHK